MECQEWKIWESREFQENTINVPTFHEKKEWSYHNVEYLEIFTHLKKKFRENGLSCNFVMNAVISHNFLWE